MHSNQRSRTRKIALPHMCACSHPHAQSHAHTQFCTDHFARTLTAAHTFFTATLAHSNVGKKQHTAIVDSFKFVGLWPSPARNMGKPVGAQGKPVGAHGKTSRGPWPAPLKETRMPRHSRGVTPYFFLITLYYHTGSLACHVYVNYLEIFRLRHFWVPLLCRPHLSAGHA